MIKKSLFAVFILISAAKVHSQEYTTAIFEVNGIAIDGYDPVAFFTKSEAKKGSQNLSTEWKGATWLFVSQENLDSFEANPEKYAPQYGGYCAYGMSNGYKAKVEPQNTWTIVDDKLYLNFNAQVKKLWVKDKETMIQTADENWKKFDN